MRMAPKPVAKYRPGLINAVTPIEFRNQSPAIIAQVVATQPPPTSAQSERCAYGCKQADRSHAAAYIPRRAQKNMETPRRTIHKEAYQPTHISQQLSGGSEEKRFH